MPIDYPEYRFRLIPVIFIALSIIYLSNNDLFQHNDATANIYLAENIVQNKNITFKYENYPFMFVPLANGSVRPNYYLTPLNQDKSVYLNRFGIGTGLVLTPVFMFADYVSPGILNDHFALWHLNKYLSSLLTALSAVLVYLIALAYVRPSNAVIICLIYALATSAWSYNSQSMFQHTSCNFFLLLGFYFLSKKQPALTSPIVSALALAIACWCRPTCLIFVVFTGLYFFLNQKKHFYPYFIISFASVACLALYNYQFTGSPFSFPQTYNTDVIASNKTGSPDVWQTPFFAGMAGILVSPARGLFVYSPVLIFSLYGLCRVFRNTGQFKWLFHLSLAAVLILIIDAKWFDWWGGWCFGYRLIMETVPVLALLLIPVIDSIRMDKKSYILFILFFFWSVITQFIGAFAYDIGGWDNRIAYEIKINDTGEKYILDEYASETININPDTVTYIKTHNYSIDSPEYRYRLWSLSDSPVSFYIRYFSQARNKKIRQTNKYLESISQAKPVTFLQD